MKEILEAAKAEIAAGRSVALSTIVAASGSLPMSRRSKMLLLATGRQIGSVGGGCLEAEILSRGREALASGSPALLQRFTLTEDQAGADGLNCGGTVEILTEVLAPGPVAALLDACLELLESRRTGVLATRLDATATAKLLLRRDGSACGSLGDPEAERMALEFAGEMADSEAIRRVETPSGGRLYLEVLGVPARLIVFGGGHVAREVVRVAKVAGFRVEVVDDRPAFANLERHPEADAAHVLDLAACLDALDVDAGTYLLAVTRGHRHDEAVVRQALRSRAAYVGMIGSARKVALMKRGLAGDGFSRDEIERLHAPVGLAIGADTPGEIAVSIVAELIAVRRKGGADDSSGRSMRLPAL